MTQDSLTTQPPSTDYRDAVVAGVDGSEGSLVAARWAAQFARGCGRDLVIVLGPAADETVRHSAASLASAADDRVEATTGMLRSALKTASESAALVVLPLRGAHAPVAQLMDAVADDVLTGASGPVALVPRSTWNALTSPIVVGLDPDQPDETSLAFAAEAAARLSAPLAALVAHDADHSIDDAVSAITGAIQNALAPVRQNYPLVHVDVVTSPWEPADALTTTGHDAAFVVVGARAGSGFRAPRHDSQSRRLLRQATCPVVVVPAVPAR